MVSVRSAKDFLSNVQLMFTTLKNESSGHYSFNLDNDFNDIVVGFKAKNKCFSFYPRPSGGLEKTKGIIFLDFNAANNSAFEIEINYPGQYHYYMAEIESKKDVIAMKPGYILLYYVIISLGKVFRATVKKHEKLFPKLFPNGNFKAIFFQKSFCLMTQMPIVLTMVRVHQHTSLMMTA